MARRGEGVQRTRCLRLDWRLWLVSLMLSRSDCVVSCLSFASNRREVN